MKDPTQVRTGKPRKISFADPRPTPLPRRMELHAGESDGPDPEDHRVRQHLHRFFEELLRRSEH